MTSYVEAETEVPGIRSDARVAAAMGAASACQVHPRPAQIWMIGPAAGTPGNLGSPPDPCIKRYGRHAVAKVTRLGNDELVIWPPVKVQFVACFAPLSSELDF